MSSMMRGDLRMAVSSVRSAKWRSLLTVLGVVIGIVAVVTVVGLGEGMKRQITGSIEQFGEELITVRPVPEQGGLQSDADIVFGQAQSAGLSADDAVAVAQLPSVDAYAPLGVVPGIVQAGEQQLHGGQVIATSSDFPQVTNQPVRFGGFWEPGQETGNFAALGAQAAVELFGEPAPLGRSLEFRGESFIVRAVLDSFGSVPLSPTSGFDNSVFIPFKTADRLTGSRSGSYALLAKPGDVSGVDGMRVDITSALKDLRGGEQDFSVLTAREHVEVTTNAMSLLSNWIISVAAISLLIGGVGLMNLMLVSVDARMREIGVRKAVGATNRQVMWQFMLESAVLSALGGLIGIALSGLVHVVLLAYTDLEPVFSWVAFAAAAVVALGVGIVFGTIPAIKAANRDPIEALRHE